MAISLPRGLPAVATLREEGLDVSEHERGEEGGGLRIAMLNLMPKKEATETQLARMLAEHPKVRHVAYPGMLEGDAEQQAIYERQCTGPGSLIAFEVAGGETEAFWVLNRFEVCRLAVSLGGTESLMTIDQLRMLSGIIDRFS